MRVALGEGGQGWGRSKGGGGSGRCRGKAVFTFSRLTLSLLKIQIRLCPPPPMIAPLSCEIIGRRCKRIPVLRVSNRLQVRTPLLSAIEFDSNDSQCVSWKSGGQKGQGHRQVPQRKGVGWGATGPRRDPHSSWMSISLAFKNWTLLGGCRRQAGLEEECQRGVSRISRLTFGYYEFSSPLSDSECVENKMRTCQLVQLRVPQGQHEDGVIPCRGSCMSVLGSLVTSLAPVTRRG